MGASDGFLIKYCSGDSLAYSTYLGGSSADSAESVVVIDEGMTYVAGWTESSNFPMISGNDTSHNGGRDAYVLCFNNSAFDLIFSTFLGGSSTDTGVEVVLDQSEAVYVAGHTLSTNFPTTTPYDAEHNGNYDIFATKFDTNLSTILYSTYIGGSDNDYARGAVVDVWGNLAIGGMTQSTNFPTEMAYDNTSNGDDDGFALKLNMTGNGLQFSTYFGHSSADRPYGIGINNLGEVYLTGYTWSDDFPLVNPIDSIIESLHAMFLLKFSNLGDWDNDGLGNSDETRMGTDPNNNDTDSDEIPDMWEFLLGLNATLDDADEDPDLDGLDNYLEYIAKTNPFHNDTDLDSLIDGDEVLIYLSDPLDTDSDDDTISDGDEVHLYGTSPTKGDTDDDGMPDPWEISNGLEATVNDAEADPDEDELSNIDEYLNCTNPMNNDTDSDLMPDGWEVHNGLNATHDDAGEDPDNDGLTNLEEYLQGMNPQLDDVSPVIHSVHHDPTDIELGDTITVFVNATDANDLNVLMVSNHTGEWANHSLLWNSSLYLYTYSITDLGMDGWCSYYILAIDPANNSARSEDIYYFVEVPTITLFPITEVPPPFGLVDLDQTLLVLVVAVISFVALVYILRKD
jgi:hypothetical protein